MQILYRVVCCAIEDMTYSVDLPAARFPTLHSVFLPDCRVITNVICSYTSFASAPVPWPAVLSRFRGLPQDVAVPSRFRRRESVEKIQM